MIQFYIVLAEHDYGARISRESVFWTPNAGYKETFSRTDLLLCEKLQRVTPPDVYANL